LQKVFLLARLRSLVHWPFDAAVWPASPAVECCRRLGGRSERGKLRNNAAWVRDEATVIIVLCCASAAVTAASDVLRPHTGP